MAKGYPDFYGFSVFPKWGPVVLDLVDVVICIPGVTTTIHEVAGKGVITGGFCTPIGDFIAAPPVLTLSIDNEPPMLITVLNLWVSEVFSPSVGPIYLSDYRMDGTTMGFCFSPGVTFDESYTFTFLHNEVGNKNVHSLLFYTRIL